MLECPGALEIHNLVEEESITGASAVAHNIPSEKAEPLTSKRPHHFILFRIQKQARLQYRKHVGRLVSHNNS